MTTEGPPACRRPPDSPRDGRLPRSEARYRPGALAGASRSVRTGCQRQTKFAFPPMRRPGFLEAAAEALHDPALGLHLAEGVNPREMGLLFYVTSAGKDLGEALALFARYCRIVNEAIRLQLKRRESDLVVEGHLVGVPKVSGHAERRVWSRGYREDAPRDHRPAYSPDHHNTGPRAKRDIPGNLSGSAAVRSNLAGLPGEIVFSPQSLAAPLITEDVHLLDALRPICDEAAKQRETATGSLRASVENEAQKLLPHGKAQRQNVAKRLAMSTRTLARKLASEGTTFEDVVDELRRSLALQYINTPSISLSQMAWLLGYEGSTSFNHAFRRWTGAPPSAARGRETASSRSGIRRVHEITWRQNLSVARTNKILALMII